MIAKKYQQNKFAFFLSIWCEDVSISRSQHASLLEILKSLKDTRPPLDFSQTALLTQ
jgi:hypothetical protein